MGATGDGGIGDAGGGDVAGDGSGDGVVGDVEGRGGVLVGLLASAARVLQMQRPMVTVL